MLRRPVLLLLIALYLVISTGGVIVCLESDGVQRAELAFAACCGDGASGPASESAWRAQPTCGKCTDVRSAAPAQKPPADLTLLVPTPLDLGMDGVPAPTACWIGGASTWGIPCASPRAQRPGLLRS